jgi:hypothetical protein
MHACRVHARAPCARAPGLCRMHAVCTHARMLCARMQARCVHACRHAVCTRARAPCAHMHARQVHARTTCTHARTYAHRVHACTTPCARTKYAHECRSRDAAAEQRSGSRERLWRWQHGLSAAARCRMLWLHSVSPEAQRRTWGLHGARPDKGPCVNPSGAEPGEEDRDSCGGQLRWRVAEADSEELCCDGTVGPHLNPPAAVVCCEYSDNYRVPVGDRQKDRT